MPQRPTQSTVGAEVRRRGCHSQSTWLTTARRWRRCRSRPPSGRCASRNLSLSAPRPRRVSRRKGRAGSTEALPARVAWRGTTACIHVSEAPEMHVAAGPRHNRICIPQPVPLGFRRTRLVPPPGTRLGRWRLSTERVTPRLSYGCAAAHTHRGCRRWGFAPWRTSRVCATPSSWPKVRPNPLAFALYSN